MRQAGKETLIWVASILTWLQIPNWGDKYFAALGLLIVGMLYSLLWVVGAELADLIKEAMVDLNVRREARRATDRARREAIR